MSGFTVSCSRHFCSICATVYICCHLAAVCLPSAPILIGMYNFLLYAHITGLTCVLLFAARAMLMKADIMLLDEPTNHLDVKNVAWLEHYLTHLPDVTSMVVSHDSGFLDNVCTGIIHYENRKLKHYVVCLPH